MAHVSFSLMIKGGLKNPKIIRKSVDEIVLKHNKHIMKDIDIQFIIPALDITKRKSIYYSSSPMEKFTYYDDRPISETIRSSSSIPVIFTPNFVCRILFRVKYENLNVLNKYDKCLICPNHSRIFDPVFLYPKIDNMYSIAKSELFKNKFVSNFLSYCNAIPIKRNGKDFAGTMRILRLLKKHDKIRLFSLLYLFI